MSETVGSSSGGDVQHGGDSSAQAATGGANAPPEAPGGGRSRWTAKRIVYTVVIAAVVIFLIFKAADDLRQFVVVTLNGVTLAALYFVVASGFTLIFGLMRVVNMAHGSLYLLGGYIALKMQESWFQRRKTCCTRRPMSPIESPATMSGTNHSAQLTCDGSMPPPSAPLAVPPTILRWTSSAM